MLLPLVFGVTTLVMAWAILWRNSSLLGPTRWRGSRARRRVALTFDDGPDPRITPAVLEALAAADAPATFFCIGQAARAEGALVRRIHAAGHLLGNHAYEHDWRMNLWHPNRVARSMVRCGRVLARAAGYVPAFYRAPVGIKSPAQGLMAWKLGLQFAGWARSARDGRGPLLPAALERLARSARPGDVLLLHDGKPRAGDDAARAAAAVYREHLPAMIAALRARGLEPVRLDDLFDLPGALAPAARRERKSLFVPGVRANLRLLARHLTGEHASPARLALAVALGVFIGCTPFFGLHALLGLVAAIKLRLNKLAVFAGTNITNPVTGPLVILANIEAGCRLLTGRWLALSPDALRGLSPLAFGNRLLLYWIAGFPVATTLIALLAAAASLPFFMVLVKRTAKIKRTDRSDPTGPAN